MPDFISVGFKGQWDASGDKAVLEAVKRIADGINKMLEGAVNFSQTVQGIEKIATAFEKITKSASNVEAAMRATKKAQDEEESSIHNLIAAYKLLDQVASKPRASTAFDAKAEMDQRIAAAKAIKEIYKKADDDKTKAWAQGEWDRQKQSIRSVSAEYNRLLADSDAIAKSREAATAAEKRYLSEISKVNKEIRQYRNTTYGQEGLDRQIAGYERLKVLRKEMADLGLIDVADSTRIINRLNDQIRDLAKMKQQEAQIEREGGEASKNRRRIELLELDKLIQAHAKLNKSLSEVPADGSAANIAIRTDLEKKLQDVILRRIQLGDRNRAELVQEYEQLMRNASGVDRLQQELRVLKAVINSPLQGENLLASMERRVATIDMAIATAKELKKLGGVDGSIGEKSLASLKSERKAIVDQMQMLISDQIKEIDLIKKEEAEVKKLREQYNALRKEAAVGSTSKTHGGMLSSQTSLQESMKTIRQLYKEGGIGDDVYQRELGEIRKQLLAVRATLREYEKEVMGVEGKAAKSARIHGEALEKLKQKYEEILFTIREMEKAGANPVTIKPQYEKLRTTLKQLYEGGGISVDEYNKKNVEASKTLAALDAQTKKLHQQWGKSFKDLIKWQLEWYIGTTILLGGGYALANSFKKAFDFTQQVRDAKAVIGATEEEFRRMQESVLNIGKNIAISANDAATAIKILGQAGLSAEQAIASLDTVASLIVATGGDMEETAKSVTTVMNVWNYESGRVAEIGNVMAASLNASKLEMKDLGVIFNYLASTAAEVQWSFEETSAAAAVLSNQGVRVSTIGTGLSSVISSLLAPTKRMVDVFDQFGISIDELNPRTHSFADILDTLAKHQFGVDQAFQAFNKREARILASSINAGADAFREMTARMTGTNAMLKMVDDSMAGARRQFELLGIEMQNRFNKAMMDGENALASFARVLRWVISSASDAAIPIALLNVGLMTIAGSTKKAGDEVSTLQKVFTKIGGWWTIAAVGASLLVAALWKLTKSSKDYYDELKEDEKRELIAAEGARQRVAAMADYLKMAEKQKGKEEELASLKDKMILQDPEIVKYLNAQGIAASDSAVHFEDLAAAIRAYMEEMKKTQFKKEMGAWGIKADEFTLAEKELKKYQAQLKMFEENKPGTDTSGSTVGMKYDPKELAAISQQASDWEQKITSVFTEINNKAKSLAKDPEGLAQFKEMIRSAFILRPDVYEKAAAGMDAAVEDQLNKMKKRNATLRKEDIDHWKETNDNLKKSFEEQRMVVDENIDYMIQRLQHSNKSEQQIAEESVSLYKQKTSMMIALIDEEESARIASLENVNMSAKQLQTETAKIEMDAAKKKMKVWDDMNKQIEQIVTAQIQQTDYMYKAAVDKSQMQYDIRIKNLENERLTEAGYARESVRLERQKVDEMIGLYRGEASKKKSIVESLYADEKEKRKKITEITKDQLDQEQSAYESLKTKLIEVFDASKQRAAQLREDFKKIQKNIQESYGMANKALQDIFGKADVKPSQVLSEVTDSQAKIKKLISQNTKESLDQAAELAKSSLDTLKGIDYNKWKDRSGPTLRSDIEDAANEAEDLYRKSQKALALINRGETVTEEGLQSSLVAKINAVQNQIDMIADQKIKLGFEVREGEKERVTAVVESQVKPVVKVSFDADPAKAKEELEKFYSNVEKPENAPRVPVIPFSKEEDLAAMRAKLTEPQNSPLTIDAVNWNAIASMLAELARPITKHVTIVEHKAGGGGDGGGGEEVSAEEAYWRAYEGWEGYATGGWLAGYGGGDRIPIMAEAGEFINRKESVAYYSKELFDLLNQRAIPRWLIADILQAKGVQRFARGGQVKAETSSSSGETFTLSLTMGKDNFPLEVSKNSKEVFEQFVDRYEKEKLMRRKR